MLVNRDWAKYDLIMHEAGVPPIHTPPKVLQTLPDEVKKNLVIYHIANKDVPKEGDIKKALPGFTNTYELIPRGETGTKVRNLELVSNISLFREMPLRRLSDLFPLGGHYFTSTCALYDSTGAVRRHMQIWCVYIYHIIWR